MSTTFIAPSYSVRSRLNQKFNEKENHEDFFKSLSHKVMSFSLPLALTPSVVAQNNLPASKPLSKFSLPSRVEIYNTGKKMIKDALYETFVEPVINFFIDLWEIIVLSSPIIGASVAIIAIPFYLAGHQKAKKIAVGSFLVVFFILVLDIFLKSL